MAAKIGLGLPGPHAAAPTPRKPVVAGGLGHGQRGAGCGLGSWARMASGSAPPQSAPPAAQPSNPGPTNPGGMRTGAAGPRISSTGGGDVSGGRGGGGCC